MTILEPKTFKDLIALSEAPKSIRDFNLAAYDFETGLQDHAAGKISDVELSQAFDQMTGMVPYVAGDVGGWSGEVSEEEFAGIKDKQAAYQTQYRKVLGLELTN